jgi:hypothetical protein
VNYIAEWFRVTIDFCTVMGIELNQPPSFPPRRLVEVHKFEFAYFFGLLIDFEKLSIKSRLQKYRSRKIDFDLQLLIILSTV